MGFDKGFFVSLDRVLHKKMGYKPVNGQISHKKQNVQKWTFLKKVYFWYKKIFYIKNELILILLTQIYFYVKL